MYQGNATNLWYDKLSYVPQNIYLLDEVLKNILLGVDEGEENKKLYNEAKNISLSNELINLVIKSHCRKWFKTIPWTETKACIAEQFINKRKY